MRRFLHDINGLDGVDGPHDKRPRLSDDRSLWDDVLSCMQTDGMVNVSPSSKPKRKPQGFKKLKIIQNETLREEETLGQGTYGMVVRGVWLNHTPVAMKKHVKAQPTKQAIKVLTDEATLLGRLIHPNIVTLYGVYLLQAPDQYGLVLELMSSNLSAVIKDLTCMTRQAYAMDIIQGLVYVHSQDVIHCDLKPANILIEGNKAKLCDFGHAKRLKTSRQRQTGQVTQTCTWPYAAPEVVRNKQSSFASDVWSFSMVLWEMAMGTWPYSNCGVDDYEVKKCITENQKPSTQEAIEERTSKDYADLIAACWKERAQDRPSTQSVAHSVSVLPQNV
jgi:serine/threonine protein kinase